MDNTMSKTSESKLALLHVRLDVNSSSVGAMWQTCGHSSLPVTTVS